MWRLGGKCFESLSHFDAWFAYPSSDCPGLVPCEKLLCDVGVVGGRRGGSCRRREGTLLSVFICHVDR